MVIDYLANHPEFIPTLAGETLDYYRSILRDETFESRCAKLRSHMNKDRLPIMLIAYANDQVFGMAALREHDLEGHEDLTPWLGGVFVRSQYRRHGIGSALCRAIEEKAWLMDFGVLYLFTIDQQRLYTRLGWQHLQASFWRGCPIDIMMKRHPRGAVAG
jgi:GNAT superfamily N-acetyltransferase